jgi:hypothetical protein
MAGKPRKTGPRKKRPTPDQRRAREGMRVLSVAWNDLTEEQRLAWNGESRDNRRGGVAARSRRHSGRSSFFKANSRRLALKQDLLTDPPASGSVCPFPIVRLVITNHGGRIALKLRFSSGRAEGVMVSATRPCNAGVTVGRKFCRISLLSATERGMIDITKPYVARFGLPPVGKKLFIRVQQMNDYMGSVIHTTSAIVPDEEGWDRAWKTP